MPHRLEYHVLMRPVIPLSVAVLAVVAVGLFLPASQAQVNGPPASVTSQGFGGRPINGAPASVTSLGPHGYAPGPQVPLASAATGFHHNDGHHQHHHDGAPGAPLLYAYPVPYAVPVPYATDNGPADEDSDGDNDPNYQGGPTVFDRRGSGASSYVPPVTNAPPPHATDPDDPPAAPGPPQPPTLLVFKDGHKIEVGNYAIVGTTLFDLTPGHQRRIAMADLDLDATRKQNDDRGVIFQLPAGSQAN
jgi:hypothetical protein